MDLQLTRSTSTFRGLDVKCFWYPGITFSQPRVDELIAILDSVNQSRSPLDYGFFDHSATLEKRREFLNSSIWCLILKRGEPCGFVYNCDLGEAAHSRVIHQGLVKFNVQMGPDVMLFAYLCMMKGNFQNYGRFLATSVSHIPSIISLFHDTFMDCQPRLTDSFRPSSSKYQAACEALIDRYLVPVLEYDRECVDLDAYRIRDSMKTKDHGFKTLWRTLPKSGSRQRDAIIANLLGADLDDRGAKVVNDLIQVGWCDERVFAKSRNKELLAEADPILEAIGQATPHAPISY